MAGNKLQSLNKQIGEIRGAVSQEATLRPVWSLYDEQSGELVQKVTMDGQTVTEPGENDVHFSCTVRMWELLNSGKRLIISEGGRSSGKSQAVAKYMISRAIVKPEKILCGREIQNSIRDSVRELMVNIILDQSLLRDFFYDIQRDYIGGKNGSSIIFKGIRELSIHSLKSYENISLVWVEEANTLSRRSFETLTPTVRREGSQLLFTLNRVFPDDFLYKEYIAADQKPGNCEIGRFRYWENPWCPSVIKEEAQELKKNRPEQYQHVYGGEILSLSDDRIFSNWKVLPEDFDIMEVIRYRLRTLNVGIHGTSSERKARKQKAMDLVMNDWHTAIDWGFVDPSVIVLLYREPLTRTLYIWREFYKSGLSVSEFGRNVQKFLKDNDRERWPVYCDHSRPELIRELKISFGINSRPCHKGRIVDELEQLQAWKIAIHPSCVHAIQEFGLYSWKKDSSGTPLPIPEDKNNHLIDSVRYSVNRGQLFPSRNPGRYKPRQSVGRC